MKRACAVHLSARTSCAGPIRLLWVVQDESVVRRIPEHLGLAASAPPRGRPWGFGFQPQLALDEPDRYDDVGAMYRRCPFDTLSPARSGVVSRERRDVTEPTNYKTGVTGGTRDDDVRRPARRTHLR